MNHRDTPSTGARRSDADIEAIARLLPPPAHRGLPHEQHLHHKERLMRTIDRDKADRTDRTDHTGRSDRTDQAAPGSRPARRLLRPALLVPVTALALGGILVTGVALTTGDDAPAGAATGRHDARNMQPAAALLDRISDAAGRGDALHVEDDQFVYTRSKVREADLTSGKAVVGPVRDTESWVSQEPGPLRKLGLTRSEGETLPINAQLGDTHGTPEGLGRPTYHWLSTLPTDPEKLLDHLYAKVPKSDEAERDQAVFDSIGSLLGGATPPDTAAALYRAAARIPGVTKVPSAKDLTGRTGVAIARDDKTFGARTEWVFDPQDLTFLGSRSYLFRDTTYGKAGTLMSAEAVIDVAVVDKAGQAPATSQES
ncbi:CU044_5270 family protein [Streptomyces sp. Je 1-369]|uniref:CU044_5270 family protein n=1 Tax=Streptomyces sp. Je 1-369 TaxID=2966192 RepID=UPI002285D891|nr:CU044_5270 family protein [Streptomyces sp. Je 1-369]WAL99496.1 CU044_5270 family protein [Streptomyces sp. Je 1-369]